MRKNHHLNPSLGPWLPRCEALEGRVVLSASFETSSINWLVLGVTPDPARSTSVTPTEIAVRFDHEISPDSIIGGELLLIRDADGQSALTDTELWSNHVDERDPNRLVIALEPGHVLGPGSYSIVLSGSAGLFDTDFNFLDTAGTDQRVGGFEVRQPGVVREDARPTSPLGPSPFTASGTLALETDPAALDLFRVELPASRSWWRLGAAFEASDHQDPLTAGLTLFDSDGQPIARGSIAHWHTTADRILFAGLAPGTYFVGVAGSGMTLGGPDGYDIVAGVPGQVSGPQTGGAYTLSLLAAPSEAPASLLGFRLDHADATRSTPTGFALQFTEPIRVDAPADALTRGIEVVDAEGVRWPIQATTYDQDAAHLTYVFTRQLPPGGYTVRLPEGSGLTDLAGHHPIRPGMPPNALATFLVLPEPANHRSGDLGPLFPADHPQGWERLLDVAAGGIAELRFVTVTQGFARVSADSPSGPVGVTVLQTRDGVKTPVDASGQGGGFLDLGAGTYTVLFRVASRGVKQITVKLEMKGSLQESLLLNGVGQGPAVALQPVTAGYSLAPADSPPATPAAASSGLGAYLPAFLTGLTGTDVGGVDSTAPGGNTTSGPAGLYLSLGGGLVGLPAPGSDQVAALAPGPGISSALLASGGLGLSTGVSLGTGQAGPGPAPVLSVPTPAGSATAGTEAAPQGVPIEVASRPAGTAPATPPELLDRLLAQLDWLRLIFEARTSSLAGAEIAATEPAATSSTAAVGLKDQDGGDTARGPSPWVDPLAVVSVLGLVVFPFRDRLRERLGTRHSRGGSTHRLVPTRSAGPG